MQISRRFLNARIAFSVRRDVKVAEFAAKSGAVSVRETALATRVVVFGGDLRGASH